MSNDAAQAILKKAPVVPVITINDPGHAVPLAEALIAGGIPVLEVTLRTEAGLESIRRIKNEVDGAIVGAGTVLGEADLDNALQAGSEFIITPGLTDALLQAGASCGVPFMPGIATVSEMMRCREKGLKTLKFFPAEANGGAKALAAFSGPFPDMRFCPTGGIGLANLADYIALPAVLSVGGTWVAPEKLIANQQWDAITQLAREAATLVSQLRSK